MIDQPISTRSPRPLRLRTLTPDDADAFARGRLRVERIEWRATTVNPRSRALAERLGFRYEGTLRRSYVLHDERYDIDVLSLVGAELDGVGLS